MTDGPGDRRDDDPEQEPLHAELEPATLPDEVATDVTDDADDPENSDDAAKASQRLALPMRLWRRLVDVFRHRGADVDDPYRVHLLVSRWVMVVATALWVLIFAQLVIRRHNHFGTYSFDLGVYDQTVYLLSRFRSPFITVRGLHQWGFHANFLLYIFVPFYWLGAGPNFLNVVFVITLGLGSYPVYRIGLHYFRNPLYGLTFALLYLANPSLQFMAWETFHPDGMAMLPLLFAWLYLLTRRWRAFFISVAIALLWKEDVALATAMIGMYILLFLKGDRAKGLLLTVLSGLYFQLINKVFLGHFNGDSAFYNTWFTRVGDTPTEIAYNIVRHPDIVTNALRERFSSEYAWKMLTPFAWLALLSPAVLLFAVPQFLANVLADQTFFRDFRYHYAAVVVVGLMVATIATVKTFGNTRGRRMVMMVLLVVCGVRTSQLWGVAPYSEAYDGGYWVHRPGPADDSRREAIRMVPDDATVAAIYNLLPHVDHRTYIYDFPNPWIPTNWGLVGENIDDPATVDYLLVERATLGLSAPLVDALVQPGGQFTIIFERDGVVLAQRQRPPERREVLPGTPEAVGVKFMRAQREDGGG